MTEPTRYIDATGWVPERCLNCGSADHPACARYVVPSKKRPVWRWYDSVLAVLLLVGSFVLGLYVGIRFLGLLP